MENKASKLTTNSSNDIVISTLPLVLADITKVDKPSLLDEFVGVKQKKKNLFESLWSTPTKIS